MTLDGLVFLLWSKQGHLVFSHHILLLSLYVKKIIIEPTAVPGCTHEYHVLYMVYYFLKKWCA